MKNYEFILIEKLLNIEANPNRVMIILSFHFLYFFCQQFSFSNLDHKPKGVLKQQGHYWPKWNTVWILYEEVAPPIGPLRSHAPWILITFLSRSTTHTIFFPFTNSHSPLSLSLSLSLRTLDRNKHSYISSTTIAHSSPTTATNSWLVFPFPPSIFLSFLLFHYSLNPYTSKTKSMNFDTFFFRLFSAIFASRFRRRFQLLLFELSPSWFPLWSDDHLCWAVCFVLFFCCFFFPPNLVSFSDLISISISLFHLNYSQIDRIIWWF